MEIVKFFHFFGLMLGAGAGIGQMVAAIALKKTEGEALAAVKIMKPLFGMIGMTGILILWVSGIIMTAPLGFTSLGSLFYVKLAVAAAVLGISLWVMIKMRGHAKAGSPPAPSLEKLGKLNGPLSILTVALAVYIFN